MKNRILQVLLTLMLVLFVPLCIKGWSADAAPLYTYTVTISAGNQGSFPNESGIGVDNTASGSDYQIKNDGKMIRITGLHYGDIVSCNAPGMTELSDNSKYYVKGIRESGRDNNTVSASAFKVTKDTDYVVAYGIPGELTEYSIYYVDEDGVELAPSQTYFGNVGDEPVIAYLYIDGYVPAAYTETQKLVSDPSENVFIFVYMRAEREQPTAPPDPTDGPITSGTPAPQVIATEIVVEETEIVTVTEEPTYVEETEPADDDSDSDGDENNANGDASADNENKGILGTIGDAIGGALSQIGDAVTPLANFVKDKVEKMAEDGTLVPVIIGLIALVALIIILILFLKRRKKDDEEEKKAKTGKKDSAGDQKPEKTKTEKTESKNSETDKK